MPGAGIQLVVNVSGLPMRGADDANCSGRPLKVPVANGIAIDRSVDVSTGAGAPGVKPTTLRLVDALLPPNVDIEP